MFRFSPKVFNLRMPQRESPAGTIAQGFWFVTKCQKNWSKIVHRIFCRSGKIRQEETTRNVHLRISVCEMQKVSSDAVYAAEKICQSLRSLNLRLTEEKIRKRKENLHGYVPFPAQIG